MSNELKVVEYHDGHRFQTGLLRETRTRLHLVVCDRSVRVLVLRKDEQRFMQERVYPISKAKKILRRRGRAVGISKAAKKIVAVNS